MTKQTANKKEGSTKQEWKERIYKMTDKIKIYIISSCITIIVPSAVGVIKSLHTRARVRARAEGRTDA